jgi:hypothetical protein
MPADHLIDSTELNCVLSRKGDTKMTTEQDFITIKQKYSARKERRRLEVLWWAVALIWAGLVFGAEGMGLMPQIGDASAWSWIFLGAGTVGMLGSFYRLASTDVPNPTAWDWIWGSTCLIIGMDGFATLNIFLSLILILVGGIALVNGLRPRN